MTRLRHFDELGTARFITFSCYRRMNYFTENQSKELFIKYLDSVRLKYDFQIYGYVIMPEHIHLVIYPRKTMHLGLVIREIKSKMAREYFVQRELNTLEGQHVFWQKRCYDHNCRSLESVIEKINYCHMNPVKRNLVETPGEWRWSSYNYYQGKSNVPLIVDRVEL